MGFQYGNEGPIFDPAICVICKKDTTGPGRVRVCPECKAEARAETYDSGDVTNFECSVRDERLPDSLGSK